MPDDSTRLDKCEEIQISQQTELVKLAEKLRDLEEDIRAIVTLCRFNEAIPSVQDMQTMPEEKPRRDAMHRRLRERYS